MLDSLTLAALFAAAAIVAFVNTAARVHVLQDVGTEGVA